MSRADPDRPCPHEDFAAIVEVHRLTKTDDGPVVGYTASIWVRCAGCDEPFRWTGTRCGVSQQGPMCSLDETELRAPLRPASADPDVGMAISGFSVIMREPS